jgi:hypothetical protein
LVIGRALAFSIDFLKGREHKLASDESIMKMLEDIRNMKQIAVADT